MNHVQSPPRESSKKQQEIRPEMSLKTEIQHSSKFHLENKDRYRPAGRYTYNTAHTRTEDSGLSLNRASGP